MLNHPPDTGAGVGVADLGHPMRTYLETPLPAGADASGIGIDGPEGLLGRITKTLLERALDAELADYLGYEAGDPAGAGSGNSRNGYGGAETVHTDAGPVELVVPRDRIGTFTPAIVPKRTRRLATLRT